LHAKAKESPDYRFYVLYDKVYRADVLWHAYRICQSNGGSAGVDGQTFDDIEKYGRKQWLDLIRLYGSDPKPSYSTSPCR
jgi:predicted phosphoadenosine phosphosulfate sulfurtransferase